MLNYQRVILEELFKTISETEASFKKLQFYSKNNPPGLKPFPPISEVRSHAGMEKGTCTSSFQVGLLFLGHPRPLGRPMVGARRETSQKKKGS
jgi:hypothetical protein